MTTPPSYAEEYTRTERLRLIAIIVLAGALLIATGKFWLFPAFKAFVASAPCRSVWGMNGTTVLFYGIFVGFPLFAGALTFATLGWRGVQILRHRQVPPPGEKVFRPTAIRTGASARRTGWLHLLAALPFIGVAAWGYVQAGEILNTSANPAGAQNCAGQSDSATPAKA